MEIERDVGGVQGFHVMKRFCTEEHEKFLFLTQFPQHHLQGPAGRGGHSHFYHEHGPPEAIFELLNAVRDTGLCPYMTDPDYCLALNYEEGGTFAPHFDSRYRWGETVMGVCLGAPAVIKFSAHVGGKASVDIPIERRCIYVMTGESRVDWKHSIHSVNKMNKKKVTAVPSWNLDGLRRSLTLRSTKTCVCVLHIAPRRWLPLVAHFFLPALLPPGTGSSRWSNSCNAPRTPPCAPSCAACWSRSGGSGRRSTATRRTRASRTTRSRPRRRARSACCGRWSTARSPVRACRNAPCARAFWTRCARRPRAACVCTWIVPSSRYACVHRAAP